MCNPPMDKYEVRRLALQRLVTKMGRGAIAHIAEAIGKEPNYVSRMLYEEGKPGRKRIGESSADDLNAAFPGWLDDDHAAPATPASNIDPAPDLRPGSRVPVVGSVKGGPDGYMDELQYPVGVGEGFVEYWTPDKTAYALRVKGDSMHPRYRAGEIIVVTPSIEPVPGRDVVVKLKDGQKLLKQLNWIKSGEVQLLSINNGYAPMTIDLQDIDSIHRVGGSVPPDAFCAQ